jgi:hypothetical protein
LGVSLRTINDLRTAITPAVASTPYSTAAELEVALQEALATIKHFGNSEIPDVEKYSPSGLTVAKAKKEFATQLEATLKRVAARDKLTYTYAFTPTEADTMLAGDEAVRAPNLPAAIAKLRAAGVVQHLVVGSLSGSVPGRTYGMSGFGLWLKPTEESGAEAGRKIIVIIDGCD